MFEHAHAKYKLPIREARVKVSSQHGGERASYDESPFS